MMNRLLPGIASLLTLLPLTLVAEERVGDVHYFEQPHSISAVEGREVHQLFELPEPGITSPVYALKGMVRYDDVEGDAFLQMDSSFGDKGTFFSKSLAPAGPLRKISGSSDWRAFTLPFFANAGDQAGDAPMLPDRVSLSVVLPGAGTISIRDVKLFQYAAGENPLADGGAFIGDRMAGMVGGIGGAFIGLWGALLGVLSGRGKARTFVLGSANLLLILGVASIILGIAALATSQPGYMQFTLLLTGFILIVVFGKLRGTLAARYEQMELQRMRAMDA